MKWFTHGQTLQHTPWRWKDITDSIFSLIFLGCTESWKIGHVVKGGGKKRRKVGWNVETRWGLLLFWPIVKNVGQLSPAKLEILSFKGEEKNLGLPDIASSGWNRAPSVAHSVSATEQRRKNYPISPTRFNIFFSREQKFFPPYFLSFFLSFFFFFLIVSRLGEIKVDTRLPKLWYQSTTKRRFPQIKNCLFVCLFFSHTNEPTSRWQWCIPKGSSRKMNCVHTSWLHITDQVTRQHHHRNMVGNNAHLTVTIVFCCKKNTRWIEFDSQWFPKSKLLVQTTEN